MNCRTCAAVSTSRPASRLSDFFEVWAKEPQLDVTMIQTALALFPAIAQQPSPSQSLPKPLTAVAPMYTPIAVLANVSGDVNVEVAIASDGKVRSTSALSGNKLLIHAALGAAKRWRFEPGTSDRKAVLSFSFRVMPKGTPEEELGTIFTPPFSVEVRKTIPEQTVNYDPAHQIKK